MEDFEKNSIQRFQSFPKAYNNPLIYYIFHAMNKAVLELLPLKEDSSILDVGCGTGLLLEQLHTLGKSLQLYGIDISPEMLGEAKRNLQNIPHISLQLGSGNKLPYKDNIFDYVTCVISLHHHPYTKTSLSEMKRVLKPGGIVIISDGNLDGIVRKIFYKLDQVINKEGTVYRYTKKQMYNLFQQVGYRDIRQQSQWYFNLLTVGRKPNQ